MCQFCRCKYSGRADWARRWKSHRTFECREHDNPKGVHQAGAGAGAAGAAAPIRIVDKWNPALYNPNASWTMRSRAMKILRRANHEVFVAMIRHGVIPRPTVEKRSRGNTATMPHTLDGVIEMMKGTTDDAIKAYRHPCILNFANNEVPGGGYLNDTGLKAQEENLFRKTSMSCGLIGVRDQYPLNGSVFVVRDCTLLRTGKDRTGKEFNLLDPSEHESFDAITAAAPNNRDNGKTFEDVEQDVRDILDLVFTCQTRGTLVLGAWGCGAFAPQDEPHRSIYVKKMAGVIVEYAVRYRNSYDRIVFPIPDAGMYQIFEEILLPHLREC
jgi:Microbial-type PARG, catalytic domain